MLIIKFNTVFRNLDQVHLKELNNALKSKQFISKKEGQQVEKGCKVLQTTIYHQNDPNTEVNVYLIRY